MAIKIEILLFIAISIGKCLVLIFVGINFAKSRHFREKKYPRNVDILVFYQNWCKNKKLLNRFAKISTREKHRSTKAQKGTSEK